MRHEVLISGLALWGCAGEPEIPLDDVSPASDVVPLTGEPMQGIYILGSVPDALFDGTTHYHVHDEVVDVRRAGYRVAVTRGASGLVATLVGSSPHAGADPWFNGMILNGVAGGQVRIEGSVSDGKNTKYHLTRRADIATDPWVEYCNDSKSYAVPVRGSYDRARVHHDGDVLSFACDDSAVAKCTGWGYIAGTEGPGDHDWDRHQACTLMANAKYCEQDAPRTRELTPIVIRDFDGNPNPMPGDLPRPDPLPGNPDAYYFEAGWRVRPKLGPVCLSKLRWAALSPSTCMDDLPDPRSETGGGQFCEDMTVDQLRDAGVLLVNGSKVMDAPLHIWRNPTTGDVVTTMRGYHARGEQVAPFEGYDEHVAIDSLILRNLPGSLDEASMLKLSLWEHVASQHRVIALAAPTSDYRILGFEGYAFARQEFPALVRFKLCEGTRGHYSTIGSCLDGGAGVSLGWLMPPP